MPKHNDEQGLLSLTEISEYGRIDFENYSTKPNPNKRFNPQNLIKRRGLIFDFSPRGNRSESDDENPDDYFFFCPFSSPSHDLQLTTIPAATTLPIYAKHSESLMDRKRSRRLLP
jgi:hypothetical protein